MRWGIGSLGERGVFHKIRLFLIPATTLLLLLIFDHSRHHHWPILVFHSLFISFLADPTHPPPFEVLNANPQTPIGLGRLESRESPRYLTWWV